MQGLTIGNPGHLLEAWPGGSLKWRGNLGPDPALAIFERRRSPGKGKLIMPRPSSPPMPAARSCPMELSNR